MKVIKKYKIITYHLVDHNKRGFLIKPVHPLAAVSFYHDLTIYNSDDIVNNSVDDFQLKIVILPIRSNFNSLSLGINFISSHGCIGESLSPTKH